MEEMICIELKETTLEKLEAIARWKAKQEGKAVSVEDLVGIACAQKSPAHYKFGGVVFMEYCL